MDEIQQATTNNLGCSQPGSGEEDCLSLNVFTPQVNLGEKSVFFFFQNLLTPSFSKRSCRLSQVKIFR